MTVLNIEKQLIVVRVIYCGLIVLKKADRNKNYSLSFIRINQDIKKRIFSHFLNATYVIIRIIQIKYVTTYGSAYTPLSVVPFFLREAEDKNYPFPKINKFSQKIEKSHKQ